MCSSSSLRLSEESKEPKESEESEEIEEDLEDSDDSEMNYIFEIEMDAYRQEASASANPIRMSRVPTRNGQPDTKHFILFHQQYFFF